jgi:hypothetical protein
MSSASVNVERSLRVWERFERGGLRGGVPGGVGGG